VRERCVAERAVRKRAPANVPDRERDVLRRDLDATLFRGAQGEDLPARDGDVRIGRAWLIAPAADRVSVLRHALRAEDDAHRSTVDAHDLAKARIRLVDDPEHLAEEKRRDAVRVHRLGVERRAAMEKAILLAREDPRDAALEDVAVGAASRQMAAREKAQEGEADDRRVLLVARGDPASIGLLTPA